MKNIKNFPVMKKKCLTCPFGPLGDVRLRTEVESRVLTSASQICHHPRLKGKKETHLCRGARDYQLTIFYRLGTIDAPTDRAWDEKKKSLE